LAGEIDPNQTAYEILGTKVEVKLAKSDGSTWSKLEEEEPEFVKYQVSDAVKVPHK